jgi:uncharacterized membrane protein (DUF485 family)
MHENAGPGAIRVRLFLARRLDSAAALRNSAAMIPEDERPAGERRLMRVAENPLYERLVRERSRFTWTLTGIMLAVFFGYILLVAFAREWMAQPIGGGATTIGIPLGIGVILVGILLTGIYVHRANSRFDPLIRALVEEQER